MLVPMWIFKVSETITTSDERGNGNHDVYKNAIDGGVIGGSDWTYSVGYLTSTRLTAALSTGAWVIENIINLLKTGEEFDVNLLSFLFIDTKRCV